MKSLEVAPLNTKCLIIHLERAVKRLPTVKATIEKMPLPAEVVSAVDGAQMSAVEAQAYVPKLIRPTYPFTLRPSEIATFHSHRACWKRILDEDLDAALILEDDLQFDPEVFPAALDLALSHCRPGDVIRFPIKLREAAREHVAAQGDIHLRTYDKVALGMVAQLVTREAAAKLLAITEQFDRPVDNVLQMQWLHDLRVLTVWPSGVSEISEQIGGSLIGRRSGLAEKLRREILRPIYRYQINVLAKRYLNERD